MVARATTRRASSHCTAAYSLFRRSGDVDGAVECALWLAITYKANFANFAAANGWIARAERLLEPVEPGPSHAWVWVTRAYRMPDLDAAEELTDGRSTSPGDAGDVDLELVAASQLGPDPGRQGRRRPAASPCIDEAMAAALGGEPSNLDTVVYTCCDMLNACELASDVERAAQWCQVADDFVETYGCPFLYAECRIYYGSVLAAKGRWADAERELGAGVRITAGACPGLHRRALTRLADLRIRQGRLEEAERLLDDVGGGADAESDVTLSVAALLLARGDGAGASRLLERRWRATRSATAPTSPPRSTCSSTPSSPPATSTPPRRRPPASPTSPPHGDDHVAAVALAARGRVAAADAATRQRRSPCSTMRPPGSRRIELPFEAARHALRARPRCSPAASPTWPSTTPGRRLAGFEQLGAALDADRAAALAALAGRRRRAPARRASAPSRHASRRCCACSATACRTRRSPPASTSAARPPPTTSAASSPSSTCATGPRRRRSPRAAGLGPATERHADRREPSTGRWVS